MPPPAENRVQTRGPGVRAPLPRRALASAPGDRRGAADATALTQGAEHMRRILVAIISSAILVGCASSTKIRAGANEHLAKARTLEAEGDYVRAAKEREAASKQFAKARQRAYEESHPTIYMF
jgi:outer membrane murein-binding lipoprotein Lpp